jgi:hypothetical protein
MFDLKEIFRVLKKALIWNSKPNEDTFPELPEVLVRVMVGRAFFVCLFV